MDQNKEFEVTNKHIFSLAAVMLFAPFIPFVLKSGDYDLTESDKLFINGYIKYGLLLDLILGIAAILGIISVLNNFVLILNYISQGLLILGLAGIILGIFFVFSDKPLFISKSLAQDFFKPVRAGNIDLIFYYLPIYNFYLWYFGKQDIKSYWWIKESIILSCMWILVYVFTGSFYLNMFFILVYIIRVVTLLGGIDFLPDHIKEKLDKLFEKNPEEIFGYIKGSIIYFIHKIKAKGAELNYAPQVYIDEAKKEYSNIIDLKGNKIIITEYSIFALICLYQGYYYYYEISYKIAAFVYIIPVLILIGRYAVILSNQKAVYVPIIHEAVKYLNKLFKFLK